MHSPEDHGVHSKDWGWQLFWEHLLPNPVLPPVATKGPTKGSSKEGHKFCVEKLFSTLTVEMAAFDPGAHWLSYGVLYR